MFALNRMSVLLWLQVACILIPGLVLRNTVNRQTPRTLLNMATLACVGGMFYRFIPTTLAYNYRTLDVYFPSVPELFIAFGYIALAIVLFRFAVTYFAVLPGDLKQWNYMFRRFGWVRHGEVRTP
jgi:Ni/Fe-hydrogenase subunit HybB-like protein